VEEPVFHVKLRKTGERIPVVLSKPETERLFEKMDEPPKVAKCTDGRDGLARRRGAARGARSATPGAAPRDCARGKCTRGGHGRRPVADRIDVVETVFAQVVGDRGRVFRVAGGILHSNGHIGNIAAFTATGVEAHAVGLKEILYHPGRIITVGQPVAGVKLSGGAKPPWQHYHLQLLRLHFETKVGDRQHFLQRQVGVDVALHHPNCLGQLGYHRGVSQPLPQGLEQDLLPLHSANVATLFAVAGKLLGLVTVEGLPAGVEVNVEALGAIGVLHATRHVDLNAPD